MALREWIAGLITKQFLKTERQSTLVHSCVWPQILIFPDLFYVLTKAVGGGGEGCPVLARGVRFQLNENLNQLFAQEPPTPKAIIGGLIIGFPNAHTKWSMVAFETNSQLR